MNQDRRLLLMGLLGFASAPVVRSQPSTGATIRQRQFKVPLVDAQGKVFTRFDASANYYIEDLGEGVTMEIALIPGGSFVMGSPEGTTGARTNEHPVRRVTISPFGLGVFPLTRRQWERIQRMPKVGKELCCFGSAERLDLPADIIDWTEAEEICKRLRAYTGRNYRLPSEAEWEYACRAGTTTQYHFGDGISQEVANYNDGFTRPLALTVPGSKNAPNRFGLHDMHGNVQEWPADYYSATLQSIPADGRPSTAGDPIGRALRGGGYLTSAASTRSASRFPWSIVSTSSNVGIRLAVDLAHGVTDPSLAGPGASSAASGATGVVSPGEIVSIWGSELGPVEGQAFMVNGQSGIPMALANSRVFFDDLPSAVLYVSRDQVNAVVPYGVAGRERCRVIVEKSGQTSIPVDVMVRPANPGLFTLDGSGTGLCAALNQDGTVNGPDRPAPAAQVVSLFGTGFGQTDPPGRDGTLNGVPLPVPVAEVAVEIGGRPAVVQYAGGAPGLVAGVFQVNAVVPAGIGKGPQRVRVRAGERWSEQEVLIYVG